MRDSDDRAILETICQLLATDLRIFAPDRARYVARGLAIHADRRPQLLGILRCLTVRGDGYALAAVAQDLVDRLERLLAQVADEDNHDRESNLDDDESSNDDGICV